MTDAGRAVTERLVGVGVRAELRGACRRRHFFYITRGHDVGAAGVAVRLANRPCGREIRTTGSSGSTAGPARCGSCPTA